MYVRITRGQAQPGKLDDLAAAWKQFVGDQLPGISGFRNAYFTGNRSSNTVMAFAVWEAEPDESLLNPILQDFVSRARELVVGPPTVEIYEVLEQL